MKVKKYVSGHMSVCFIVNTEDADTLLTDNQFASLVLMSPTGATIPLEVMTLDMDELVILGDDEDTDVILA